MDEIGYVRALASRCGSPAAKLPDLRLAVRLAIAARQQRIGRSRRMLTVAASCAAAAAVLLTLSVYALTGLARDLAWNDSVLHMVAF